MTGPGGSVPMSADDLQRWLVDAGGDLAAVGVRGVFGRAPRTGGGPPSSWISFQSSVGAGRLVRDDDGSCSSQARRHVDGVEHLNRSGGVTTSAELGALVDALASPPRSAR